MEPTQQLIDALRRDKLDAARQMTPEQRLRAGGELFDLACEAICAGIRMQHPGADESKVRLLLQQRLDLLERKGRL